MDLRAATDAFRTAWSEDHVCRVARDFLTECGQELETGNGLMRVPPDAALMAYNAAVILTDYGFGDHVETVIYLGVGRSQPHVWPVYGVLRLYLTVAGEMITEDRYSLAEYQRGSWRTACPTTPPAA